jgi:FkbM family methyltransferase
MPTVIPSISAGPARARPNLVNSDKVLVRHVRWRNPFRVRGLPLLARLYRGGYRFARANLAQKCGRLAARKLFRALHATGWRGEGLFELDTPGGAKQVRFDGRNTQFHSIYLCDVPNGYEPQIAALADVFVPDRGVFYDAGSNWGYYSLYVASRAGFAGSVQAFEPMPSTFGDLASCVQQAGLADRVRCHNLGLSAAEGEARMTIPDGLHSGTASVVTGPSSGGAAVKLAALDRLALPDPDLIKLDVEGHEAEALEGARSLLRRARPMIVFENWLNPDQPARSLVPMRILTELGYHLFLPGWWVDSGGGGRFVTPGYDLPELRLLALIPVTPAQRYALPPREDFFACHEDRLPELYDRFEPQEPTGSIARLCGQ